MGFFWFFFVLSLSLWPWLLITGSNESDVYASRVPPEYWKGPSPPPPNYSFVSFYLRWKACLNFGRCCTKWRCHHQIIPLNFRKLIEKQLLEIPKVENPLWGSEPKDSGCAVSLAFTFTCRIKMREGEREGGFALSSEWVRVAAGGKKKKEKKAVNVSRVKDCQMCRPASSRNGKSSGNSSNKWQQQQQQQLSYFWLI